MIKKPIELIDAKIVSTTRSDKNPNVALQHQILGILLMFLQDSAYGNDKMLMQAIERLIINDEDKTTAKKDGKGNKAHKNRAKNPKNLAEK